MNVKRTGFLKSILIVVALFVLASACSNSKPATLNPTLQSLVSGLMNDRSVKNCVLSIRSGDGSICWSGAEGVASSQSPMTKDTPIYVASITKLFTATVVMKLYEKGALALDAPMAKYLPSEIVKGIHVYNGRDYSNQITIRQLLSHSSGIADYYDQRGKDGKNLFDMFLQDQGRRWTVDETIERARRDLQPSFPPGTGTFYSDTNFQLLGRIVEQVTGRPLVDAYESLVFRPLDLKRTYLVGYDGGRAAHMEAPADVFWKSVNITRVRSNGSYWAEGGIVSTADEMITFLKALNEGRIVDRNTLILMHKWRAWRFPLEYGFGTMLFSFPRPMRLMMQMPPLWGHSGSTGSFLYYCEDSDLYLAGTIDQADSQTKPFFLMYSAIKDVRRLKDRQ
jgi:D-alanyl-D-alanine carboxypeptidase